MMPNATRGNRGLRYTLYWEKIVLFLFPPAQRLITESYPQKRKRDDRAEKVDEGEGEDWDEGNDDENEGKGVENEEEDDSDDDW